MNNNPKPKVNDFYNEIKKWQRNYKLREVEKKMMTYDIKITTSESNGIIMIENEIENENENENENEDEKEQEKSENTRQTSLNPTMQRKNERRLLDLRRQMAVAPT
jgi:hypothetical protein